MSRQKTGSTRLSGRMRFEHRILTAAARWVCEQLEPRRLLAATTPALADADVGSPGLAGSASYNVVGNAWTVQGSGGDIWGTADQFNLASLPFAGTGSVVARVTSQANTDPWAKAGVMFRADATAGAPFANLDETPANGLLFQWRSAPGAAVSAAAVTGVTGPVWLRLTRSSGNSFGAFYSLNGATWTQISGAQTIAMSGSGALAGLAVTSHNNTTLGAVTFTGVDLLPAGWSDGDVGPVGVPGSASFDPASGTWTVNGSGSDIWGTADQFNFASPVLTGDGSVVARVTTMSGTDPWAKGGVILRGDTTPGSSFASLDLTGGNGLIFEWRSAAGAAAVATVVPGVIGPVWLKLTRAGNSLSASYSSDGMSWTQIGSPQSVAMSASALAGLAVTAHSNAVLNTTTFTNLSVTSSAPSVAVAPAASPAAVTAASTSLSVLGSDIGGESALTYTWATTGTPPAPVNFSANGTNAAKNITAAFTKAGTYGLLVTVRNAQGLATNGSLSVTVAPTLTSIRVSPSTATVSGGSSATFAATAYDQFGAALATQPTFAWSTAAGGAGGTMSGGLYTAPAVGIGQDTLLAASAGISGSATVHLISTTWTDGDIGSPAISGSTGYSSRNGTWTVAGGGSDIWNNTDQFHFVSQPLGGDGSVMAQVSSQTNASPYSKAGVMIRGDLSASSAFADVVVTPTQGLMFQWRPYAGATAQSILADGTITAPVWVRLTRAGDQYAAGYSYDGVNWDELGTPQTVWLAPITRAGLAVSAVNYGALSTATFSNVAVVQSGWSDADVGGPGLAGFANYDGSNLTIAGSGADIFGTSDQFNFDSQAFVGDVTVVAKVNTLTNSGTYAKAGVMIRDGTAANASYALILLTPATGASGQGANFEYRNGAGSATKSDASTSGISAPYWVKLVRAGNLFTAFYSSDGVSWIQDGPAVNVVMSPTVQVGVAVSANGNAAINVATFSNVSVTPTGWSDSDVGSPALTGAAIFDGLNWVVNGGGSDIYYSSDQFNFASQDYTGDVTVVAHVDSQINTDNYAKAGIMIRDGTAANAGYVYMYLTPSDGAAHDGALFESRNGAGAPAQDTAQAASVSAPAWLKIVRSGNVFSGFYSSDGSNWTQDGPSVTVALSPTAKVGLAVVAHNTSTINSAVFSNVSVGATQTDPFLAQNGRDLRNRHGSGDVVHLRGTNLGAWLMYEGGFGAMDWSGLPDATSVYNTLTTRFGVAGRNRIEDAYQFNWITTTDLDDMKAMGINYIRVPFWWLNLVEPDGTWRADAFTHLDWIVSEAAKRGIYTVLDFHGMPGGTAPWGSSDNVNGGAFWTNPANQQLAGQIWAKVAAHFAGNPAVAAYELINEPAGAPNQSAMWSAENSLFWAVRNADPTHAIIVDGWTDLSSLPNPAWFNWTNVVYKFHVYAISPDGSYNPTTAMVQNATNWATGQASYYGAQYYVPILVGEFAANSDPAAFSYERWNFNQNVLSYSNWLWKKGAGGFSIGMGDYAPTTGQWMPNVQTDSLATILWCYTTVTTADHYAPIAAAVSGLGMPTAIADSYATTPGQSLYIAPASGVLANDTDPNAVRAGMSASLMSNVSHGSLILWPDGSFTYTPAAGFVGTDTFRYRAADANTDSANIAIVSIVVAPSNPPTPWSDADVGSPTKTGWSNFNRSNGSWTVASNGSDFYGTSDQFHFASEPWTGDGTIVARVTSMTNTNAWAKAGVMFRSDSTAAAPFAAVVATPGIGVEFLWRWAAGAGAGYAQVTAVAAPVWVKLARSGNTFSGYYSSDGVNWTQIGTNQYVGLPSGVRAGMAVSSANSSAISVASFSNVGVLPGGWSDSDIGTPPISGTADFNPATGAWLVGGSGSDIWGNADQFNFASHSLSGDGSILARIASLSNTDPWAKAGVMIRSDSSPGSAFVNVDETPSNGLIFQWRSTPGATPSAVIVPNITGSVWVKLTRSGNAFTAFYSTDSVNWIQIGATQTIAMNPVALTGLAVTSHNNAALNVATFINVA